MKNRSGHDLPWFQLRKPILLALAGGLLISAGCSRKPVATTEPPPSAASVKQAEADHMPVYNTQNPAQAVPVTSLTGPDGNPNLGELNRTLLRWVMRNRRPPANFDDFAATAGVTIPPPPPGKKYIIAKNMHVQLANNN